MDNRPLSYVGQGEFQLLKMMAEEIERGEYRPGSAFTPESQLYVFRRFRKLFGPLYSDRFLKSRFKNLKKRYHEFSALLNHEGIHWDKENNLVCGNEELLQELCKVKLLTSLIHVTTDFPIL